MMVTFFRGKVTFTNEEFDRHSEAIKKLKAKVERLKKQHAKDSQAHEDMVVACGLHSQSGPDDIVKLVKRLKRAFGAAIQSRDEHVGLENEAKAEVERLKGELRRLTGTQEEGDFARPFENCEHVGEDGCCDHPKAMTPECHYGADCPKYTELETEIERLKTRETQQG